MLWLRRIIIGLFILTGIGGVVSGYMWWKSRQVPAWWRVRAYTPEQQSAYANSARDKILAIRNLAEASRAHEISQAYNASQGKPTPATLASGPQAFTFAEDEVNAFALHFLTKERTTVEKIVQNPGVYLLEGHIVLAGHVKEYNRVLSLHFRPQIDKDGRLDLQLAKSYLNEMPIPTWTLNEKINKLRASLLAGIPQWQAKAKFDKGLANVDAVQAAGAELLLNTLKGVPSEPILFVSVIDGKEWLPVRLTAIEVKGPPSEQEKEKGTGEMTFTVRPLTPEERKTALERIKAPYEGAKPLAKDEVVVTR